MASNTNNPGGDSSRAQGAADQAADGLKESAEKIWLAGLGAFERMKSDGPRMFETLVEQGRNMSAKAKDAADQALRSMREANFEAGGGAGRWDKFQQDMQERVSKSLGSFGVSTTKQMDALARQVAELNEQMRNLMAASARGGAARKPSRSTAGSTARKKAAPKRKAAAKSRAKGRSR